MRGAARRALRCFAFFPGRSGRDAQPRLVQRAVQASPLRKRVWAAHKAPPKTRPTDAEAFLSLRHCAPKPHVVFGPVVYVQITHAREWIKPMASGLQKNEQSGRNHTFVASSHRHANIEEALSKKSRMGTEKFPCVSASNAMSDAAHAGYEKVNCAEVSGICTTKHSVV